MKVSSSRSKQLVDMASPLFGWKSVRFSTPSDEPAQGTFRGMREDCRRASACVRPEKYREGVSLPECQACGGASGLFVRGCGWKQQCSRQPDTVCFLVVLQVSGICLQPSDELRACRIVE